MVELSGESEELARAEALAVSRVYDSSCEIIESDVWFHMPNTFDTTNIRNVTDEEIKNKVLLVKKVFEKDFGRFFDSCKTIAFNKEVSMKTNGEEIEGVFQYRQDSARFHRFFIEIDKNITGYIYILKDTDIPEKIILTCQE